MRHRVGANPPSSSRDSAYALTASANFLRISNPYPAAQVLYAGSDTAAAGGSPFMAAAPLSGSSRRIKSPASARISGTILSFFALPESTFLTKLRSPACTIRNWKRTLSSSASKTPPMAAFHFHRAWCCSSRLSESSFQPDESIGNRNAGSHTWNPSTAASAREQYSGNAQETQSTSSLPDLFARGNSTQLTRAFAPAASANTAQQAADTAKRGWR